MKWKAWWGSLEWDGVGVGWIIWVVSSNGWPLVCLDDVKLSPNIIQEQLRQLRENLVIFIFTAGHDLFGNYNIDNGNEVHQLTLKMKLSDLGYFTA